MTLHKTLLGFINLTYSKQAMPSPPTTGPPEEVDWPYSINKT